MELHFRQCTVADLEDALPLMYAAGPETWRYVFAEDSAEQAMAFLRYAFPRSGSEFSYDQHTAGVLTHRDGREQLVAVMGLWSADKNLNYSWKAVRLIFGFYGFFKGLKVLRRGLQIERVMQPPKRGCLYLHNFGVSAEMRGKGFGQQALDYAKQQAREKGFRALSLDVAEDNPRARALYLGQGFQSCAQRKADKQGRFGRMQSMEYMEWPSA